MLEIVTTVAVLAIGQAMYRPTTKDDGWRLSQQTALLGPPERSKTDHAIFAPSYVGSTETKNYLHQDKSIDGLDYIKVELHKYQSLTDDWDGNGGSPAAAQHIVAANKLLSALPAGFALPKPMLSGDGEVGLYWSNDKFIADVVIESSNTASLFLKSLSNPNNEIFIDGIAIDANATEILKEAFLSI